MAPSPLSPFIDEVAKAQGVNLGSPSLDVTRVKAVNATKPEADSHVERCPSEYLERNNLMRRT